MSCWSNSFSLFNSSIKLNCCSFVLDSFSNSSKQVAMCFSSMCKFLISCSFSLHIFFNFSTVEFFWLISSSFLFMFSLPLDFNFSIRRVFWFNSSSFLLMFSLFVLNFLIIFSIFSFLFVISSFNALQFSSLTINWSFNELASLWSVLLFSSYIAISSFNELHFSANSWIFIWHCSRDFDKAVILPFKSLIIFSFSYISFKWFSEADL